MSVISALGFEKDLEKICAFLLLQAIFWKIYSTKVNDCGLFTLCPTLACSKLIFVATLQTSGCNKLGDRSCKGIDFMIF